MQFLNRPSLYGSFSNSAVSINKTELNSEVISLIFYENVLLDNSFYAHFDKLRDNHKLNVNKCYRRRTSLTRETGQIKEHAHLIIMIIYHNFH